MWPSGLQPNPRSDRSDRLHISCAQHSQFQYNAQEPPAQSLFTFFQKILRSNITVHSRLPRELNRSNDKKTKRTCCKPALPLLEVSMPNWTILFYRAVYNTVQNLLLTDNIEDQDRQQRQQIGRKCQVVVCTELCLESQLCQRQRIHPAS